MLTEQARGRIAFKLLVERMAKDNTIPSKETMTRELPNISREFGEKPEDIQAFAKELIPQVIAKRIGCKEVTVVW